MVGLALILLAAFFAVSAKADYQSVTCGTTNPEFKGVIVSGPNDDFYHYNDGSSEWEVDFEQWCGTGGTVLIEIQSSSDTTHWTDLPNGEAILAAQDGDPHHRVHTFRSSGTCSNSLHYRVKGWANPNAGNLAVDVYPSNIGWIGQCN